jgi:hypothetical protein
VNQKRHFKRNWGQKNGVPSIGNRPQLADADRYVAGMTAEDVAYAQGNIKLIQDLGMKIGQHSAPQAAPDVQLRTGLEKLDVVCNDLSDFVLKGLSPTQPNAGQLALIFASVIGYQAARNAIDGRPIPDQAIDALGKGFSSYVKTVRNQLLVSASQQAPEPPKVIL